MFELLNRGFMYICGRDKCYRPVMVLKMAVFNELNKGATTLSTDEVIASILLTCFFARKYMMIDGRIENQYLVVDLAGNYKVALGTLKPILKFFPMVNKGRFRAFYVVNCPMTINFLWDTIKYFLDEITQRKVQFSKTANIPDMHKLIAP